ncbi:flavodoxin domain-containing protein [Vaginisenegalia massiliensis]|uniref:flavodoxin domain-containing protein n=1 Tax=Vaginisenegalia massiliensis TaxID=2058294 RepID=UPI000F545A63|nr:flavodoxin domain-containing protein [Vaginisenegalia massiliensis]
MRKLVVYTKEFGSTEKYAEFIGGKLNCPVKDSHHVTLEDIENSDAIILGSCLLSGHLFDTDSYQGWIEQFPDKVWALYTVGLSNPQLTDFNYILTQHFDDDTLTRLKCFHFRGIISYKRLNLMDRLISKLHQFKTSSIDMVPLDDEEYRLLERYGTSFDEQDAEEVKDLIEWIQASPENLVKE